MSSALDRLTLLETFARIAERGSISAAARDLGLSQASASRHLQDLEARLGVQVVRRSTHALSLTPAGLALLGDARALLADWQGLEERHAVAGAAGEAGEVRGALKVVAPVALGQGALAEVAVRFQVTHPGVALTWELSDEAIRFAEVGCDCWVRVGPVPDDSLIVRRLGRVERLAVASPALLGGRKIDRPAALAKLPFVALAPYEGGRVALWNRRGGQADLRPEVRLSSNNIVAVRRAALMGVGAAVLPRWFVAEDLAAGNLVDVLPRWRAATFDINAAFLPARYQPRRLTLFLESLAEGVAGIPGVLAADNGAAGHGG